MFLYTYRKFNVNNHRFAFFQTYQFLVGLNFTIFSKGGVHCLETYERRTQIWEKLRVRRKDTIANLANEFGVSKQTIRRDIDALSREHYIYTLPGRYSGGVFVEENTAYIKYFNESELAVIHKLFYCAENNIVCTITVDEKNVLSKLIAEHTKPTSRNNVHIKK